MRLRPSAAETTDESPERVALVQQVTTAYLRGALGIPNLTASTTFSRRPPPSGDEPATMLEPFGTQG